MSILLAVIWLTLVKMGHNIQILNSHLHLILICLFIGLCLKSLQESCRVNWIRTKVRSSLTEKKIKLGILGLWKKLKIQLWRNLLNLWHFQNLYLHSSKAINNFRNPASADSCINRFVEKKLFLFQVCCNL